MNRFYNYAIIDVCLMTRYNQKNATNANANF